MGRRLAGGASESGRVCLIRSSSLRFAPGRGIRFQEGTHRIHTAVAWWSRRGLANRAPARSGCSCGFVAVRRFQGGLLECRSPDSLSARCAPICPPATKVPQPPPGLGVRRRMQFRRHRRDLHGCPDHRIAPADQAARKCHVCFAFIEDFEAWDVEMRARRCRPPAARTSTRPGPSAAATTSP